MSLKSVSSDFKTVDMEVGDQVTVVLAHGSVFGEVVQIDPVRGIMVRQDLGNGCYQSRYYTGSPDYITENTIHQWIADGSNDSNQ